MENAVCHFVFYTGPRKGEAQVYHTARVSIGRASNCDFRLEAFQLEQVASHHAELLLEDNAYFLYDLGTKSGTYVNGERVHDRCALVSEDYIQFGKEGPEVIFRTGEPTPGKQPLPEIFPVTAELEFFSGSDAGRIFPVNAAVTSNIGRRADLEVPLDPRGDMIVSGNHCNIRYVNGHFVLTDTSRNGTYVNGELVDQPMEILDGDVIMLGDGGPQSRFHVDNAKRHYPNHRVLSPVGKTTEAESSSSFQRAADAGAPATLASAKPFLSGSPAPDPDAAAPEPPPADVPLSEEAEIINEDVAEADMAEGMPVNPPSANEPASDDLFADSDNENDQVPPAAESAAETPTGESTGPEIPTGKSADAFSAVPGPVQTLKKASLQLTKQQKMIAGIGAGVILLVILVALFSGGDDADRATAARGNYAAAMEELEPVANEAGAFTVQSPKGWTNLNRENYVSIESADKNIAVDYVRDTRANQAHLQELLGKDGASVGQPETLKIGDKSVRVTRSSIGNLRRIGTIIPAAGAPIMAVLETTKDALDNLDEESVNQLIAENVEVTGTPAAIAQATPAPPVTQTPTPSVPAPTETAQTTPAETPEATAAPAIPAPAETTAATTAPSESDAATSAGPTVSSEALNMTLNVPAGWTGVSEEADEMIMFSDGNDLVVRIARDPGDLDAEATFKAMEEENWKKEGVQDSASYHAGEFVGENQNLMLVLIPEEAKTTLLIYATSPKDFTPEQRTGISDIMKQLLQ